MECPDHLEHAAVAVPLAVGNTVVLKASEEAPIVAGLFIADVLHEAGLPPGVLNVVTNAPRDAGEIAAVLIGDPRVRRVNFTGSTATGRIIGQLAARHLKPAVLELGGKNALIVLDDADLDYAVNATAFAAYMNAGQICMSADRIIVQRSIADELTSRLAEKARSLKSGDPTDPSTAIGPVINTRAAERIDRMVKDAVAEGARLVAGGGLDGNVYTPTVLSDVTPSMRVYSDEIFGPVCTVLTVEDAEEAIRVPNDSPYGLTAGVLTENMVRGLDVARQLQTGIVHVNDQPIADEPFAPFGGVKESGYGRFGGRAGIDAFTDLRWITIQQMSHPFPI